MHLTTLTSILCELITHLGNTLVILGETDLVQLLKKIKKTYVLKGGNLCGLFFSLTYF
jgi:hypothetical protein